MTTAPSYPVTLSGELTEPLSRWLWLVKWLLIIPHLIVLAVLTVIMALLTVFAWFAILFTGSYPRGIFDFNVGVLRWSWRVGFYSYSALGVDQYPPFNMREGGYPADLHVEYPERLSRGLIFVKWLLAIPHTIILSFLQGGVGTGRVSGLKGVLVLFAGVALLFTGRYPRSMLDFIMGINRWGYRVTAYLFLMRDEYPPFRLGE